MESLAGMYAGFMLWPWWALMLFIIMCLFDAALLEIEREGTGTAIMVIGTGAFIWIFSGVNPFLYVWNNPDTTIILIVVYSLLGGIWSVPKWFLYSIKQRNKELLNAKVARRKPQRPKSSYVRNNKARITWWISHWPFSIIGTFIGDFLVQIWDKVYEMFDGLYTRISDYVYKEFENDEN